MAAVFVSLTGGIADADATPIGGGECVIDVTSLVVAS